MKYKNSIIGGGIAFILATSCCWLPAMLLLFGGGSTILGLAAGLEKLSGIFVLLGIALLAYGIYLYRESKNNNGNNKIILQSVITCPECGYKKKEVMPTNACQYFYECKKCNTILKPSENDCCVYCSYGSVPCPPIQLDEECC